MEYGLNKTKDPLYRKVNTRARGVHHHFGGDYRHERNTKKAQRSDARRESMHGRPRRGLDYTPLFRFLLSKIGEDWDTVYAEAVARLDRTDPIFWMVARREEDRQDVVRMGQSSYYNGLYVDGDNRLQKVDPDLGPERLKADCDCCTHTFNGKPFK